jgi:Poxvirus A32 protein
METEISLKKFDVNSLLRRSFCAVVCARRGSGKSFLLKDILYHLHNTKYPRLCVYSGTDGASGFFADFCPGIFIHSPFSTESFTNIWQTQKQLIMRDKLGQLPPDTDTRLCVIMDDCSFDRKTLSHPALKELFCNGRHYNVSLILTTQYCVDIPPSLRSNVDFGFFFQDSVKMNRDRIYKSFCGFLPNLHTFECVFTSCTGNYECLCIDNSTTSNNVQDLLFYYRAKAHNDFKFGSPSMWRYHDKVFVSEEEEFLEEQRKQKKKQLKAQSSVTRVSGSNVVTVTRRR